MSGGGRLVVVLEYRVPAGLPLDVLHEAIAGAVQWRPPESPAGLDPAAVHAAIQLDAEKVMSVFEREGGEAR